MTSLVRTAGLGFENTFRRSSGPFAADQPASPGALPGLGIIVGTHDRASWPVGRSDRRHFGLTKHRDDHGLQLAHRTRANWQAPGLAISDASIHRAARHEWWVKIWTADQCRFRLDRLCPPPAVATTASAPIQSRRDVVARPAGPATLDPTRNQLASGCSNLTETGSGGWASREYAAGQMAHRIAANWQSGRVRGTVPDRTTLLGLCA